MYDLYCYMHDDCSKIYSNEAATSDEAVENFDTSAVASDDPDYNADSDSINNSNAVSQDDGSAKTFIISTQENVSLTKKIIFTVAGALLGSIPWIILPFVLDLANDLLNRITKAAVAANVLQSLLICLCAYFIPYFAIVGYRLSSGKFSRQGRWITGIVSGVVVILIQFVYLAVLIIKEPSVTLNFANYMTNIVKFNFYINMLLGALIGIVFTLISVLPYFDSNRQPVKKSKIPESKSSEIISEDTKIEETNSVKTINSEEINEEVDKKIDEEVIDDKEV